MQKMPVDTYSMQTNNSPQSGSEISIRCGGHYFMRLINHSRRHHQQPMTCNYSHLYFYHLTLFNFSFNNQTQMYPNMQKTYLSFKLYRQWRHYFHRSCQKLHLQVERQMELNWILYLLWIFPFSFVRKSHHLL